MFNHHPHSDSSWQVTGTCQFTQKGYWDSVMCVIGLPLFLSFFPSIICSVFLPKGATARALFIYSLHLFERIVLWEYTHLFPFQGWQDVKIVLNMWFRGESLGGTISCQTAVTPGFLSPQRALIYCQVCRNVSVIGEGDWKKPHRWSFSWIFYCVQVIGFLIILLQVRVIKKKADHLIVCSIKNL